MRSDVSKPNVARRLSRMKALSSIVSVRGGRRRSLLSGGLLRYLDADRRAYACRTRLKHRARVLDALDAARGLDAKVWPDGSAHQGNVRDGRARFGKARRGL